MSAPTLRRQISEQARKVARQASEFLRTAEGRQQVEKSMDQAQQTSLMLRQASIIDPKLLREPFTI